MEVVVTLGLIAITVIEAMVHIDLIVQASISNNKKQKATLIATLIAFWGVMAYMIIKLAMNI